MTTEELKIYQKKIDALMEFFDEEIGLFREMQNNPAAYHTKIKKGIVHRYKNNADFSIALMESGREKDIVAANKVIQALIDGQCTKEGDTYGLWPYFYEENLEEMDRPDWNMANFQGISLLQVLLEHEEKIHPHVKGNLIECLKRAGKCIINRDVTVNYTNVISMTSYFCVVFGERYSKEIFDYGMCKLDLFHKAIMEAGFFQEFNSPTYTIVLTNILSLMMKHIKNQEALAKVKDLNKITWRCIATNYHPTTGQWGGAQDRAYSQFIDYKKREYFERAIGGKISLNDSVLHNSQQELSKIEGNEYTAGMLIKHIYEPICPNEYVSLFTDIEKRVSYTWKTHSTIRRYATCYMTPEYVLGTTNIETGWNQKRNLLAYFGNKEKTYCLWQRALHDFYDYSSTRMYIQQNEGMALSMVIFYTNGSDTHCDLDPTNGKITAADMRICYQLEACQDGVIDEVKITEDKENNKVILDICGTKADIGFAYGCFADEKPYVEIRREGKLLCFDIVLYHGEKREFVLKELGKAMSVSYLSINNPDYEIPQISQNNDVITASWNANGTELTLTSTYTPDEVDIMGRSASQTKNGKKIDSAFFRE